MFIQFTGLSGAGKSTIAHKIKDLLLTSNVNVYVVDGDVYRNTICKDLGFSKADRFENIRRLGKVANDFAVGSNVVILAAINPYEIIRRELKDAYNAKIVYIKCDLPTLIKRDPKGLYRRALLPTGDPKKLLSFTGIDDPFEIPLQPELILDTDIESVQDSVKKLYEFIKSTPESDS